MSENRTRRVLVVEDTDTVSAMIAELLSEAGFEVNLAADGKAAVERIREREYDLILLDLALPEMDGFEVLEEIKNSSDVRDIPVLVMSAIHRQPDQIQRIHKLGASGFINKDVLQETLLFRVQSLVA